MEYDHKDEKTGETKHYEISYSQQLLKDMAKEIKRSNQLKWAMIILFAIGIIAAVFLLSDSGILGMMLRKAVCSCMTPA